jgi:hypothetical protein
MLQHAIGVSWNEGTTEEIHPIAIAVVVVR